MTDIETFRNLLAGGEKSYDALNAMNTYTPSTPHLEKWTGKVINNNDPERLGRVQIRVIGYYENLEDKWLPWAVPDISFMGGKCGSQIIPEIGSMVRGYFEKGDVQRPVYDSLAFNKYNSNSEYTGRKNFFEYPHKMVLMETDQGDFVTLNRKTGELVFTHRTGAQTIIDYNGNIEVRTGNIPNPGNLSVRVYGKADINVTRDASIFAGGNVSIDALGNVDLGSSPVKTPVCNLLTCPICGVKHSTQDKVRC